MLLHQQPLLVVPVSPSGQPSYDALPPLTQHHWGQRSRQESKQEAILSCPLPMCASSLRSPQLAGLGEGGALLRFY